MEYLDRHRVDHWPLADLARIRQNATMTLLLLLIAVGLAPLVAGLALLKPRAQAIPLVRRDGIGSILFCALAFTLTFFWQELWLVIPKALTPGLHPILYHNDHDWTGKVRIAELLQGSGAIATLASGLTFLGALSLARSMSISWRLFFFWMAFQGLYQALTQLAIGTLLPGNDVGRALAYLAVSGTGKALLLIAAVVAMAFAGTTLASAFPLAESPPSRRSRAFAIEMLIAALLSVMLIIPFRLPREIIEVVLIPLIVNLVGVGWLIMGMAITRYRADDGGLQAISLLGPTLALGVTLTLFQCVLRPGIAF